MPAVKTGRKWQRTYVQFNEVGRWWVRPISPALSRCPEVRSDMENWKEIRQQVLVNGLSQRAACEKYQLGWQTLKKILAHSEPPGYRQREARPRPVLAPVLPIIHEILVADQKAPKKQRHTAKRIFERLKAEYGYRGGKTVVEDAVRA